jgi:hypothetical protein
MVVAVQERRCVDDEQQLAGAVVVVGGGHVAAIVGPVRTTVGLVAFAGGNP